MTDNKGLFKFMSDFCCVYVFNVHHNPMMSKTSNKENVKSQ